MLNCVAPCDAVGDWLLSLARNARIDQETSKREGNITQEVFMKSRSVFAAFSLTVVVAMGLTPAFGAPDLTPNDESLVLSKIDTDHDGTISLDEAKAAASAKFDALDTDKEGTLDASELTGILSPKAVKKADRDKDDTLDKAEFLALVEKRFNAADHDHDGKLDAKELSTEEGRAVVALLAY
jgi:EF hand